MLTSLSRDFLSVYALAACVVSAASAQTRAIDADALPRLTATREVRMGTATDTARGFRSSHADVDRDGQVFVYDALIHEIRMFARDGRLVRTIGRAGPGRGEFPPRGHVSALAVAGDSVWTYDTQGRRVNVFRRDGTHVTNMTIPGRDLTIPIHDGAIGYVEPTFPLSGRFVSSFAPVALSGGDFEFRALSSQGLTNNVKSADTVRVPIVRFTPQSPTVDTIGWAPIPPRAYVMTPGAMNAPLATVQVKGMTYGVQRAPFPTDMYIASAQGTAVITRVPATSEAPSSFDVTRFDLTGKISSRVRFTYKPRRYDGPILDSLVMRELSRKGAVDMEVFRAVRAAVKFPEFQSPVYMAFIASDGALWIRREWDGSGQHRWVVMERNGNVRGLVTLPSNARPLWASGDAVIAEEPDQRHVPWLVRFRLGPR